MGRIYVISSSRAIRYYKDYPVLSGEEISHCSFVRETETNLYIQDNFNADDFIRKIIPLKTSSADVFELSVFLYGYFNEKHIGIRKPGRFFPLFLRVNKLYKRSILYENEYYTLSFFHSPNETNYWHFQLDTVDSTNKKIPRDTGKAREKRLAKFIIREYIKKAICKKSEVIPFQRLDFDRKIKPVRYFFKFLINRVLRRSNYLFSY
jgi:hypothetical protein